MMILKAVHLDFLPNLSGYIITQIHTAISDSTCSARAVQGFGVRSD